MAAPARARRATGRTLYPEAREFARQREINGPRPRPDYASALAALAQRQAELEAEERRRAEMVRTGLLAAPDPRLVHQEALRRAGMTQGEWEAGQLAVFNEFERRAADSARYEAEQGRAEAFRHLVSAVSGGEYLLEQKRKAATGRAKGTPTARQGRAQAAEQRRATLRESARRMARAGRTVAAIAKHLGVTWRTAKKLVDLR